MTKEFVLTIIAGGILLMLSTIVVFITFSLKKIIIDRLDKLEDTIEEMQKENRQSHKEIWEEVNRARERIARLEK